MNAAGPRYDVALSFAGEDRSQALALATRLQRAGLRVFFDRFEELWGQDLSERLHEVYDRQCRRVVVFVSQAYLRRPWTNFERRVLVGRALREDPGFLLPLRLDDSELPGLPGVIAYKDLRSDGIDGVADALCRLCGAVPGWAAPPLSLSPSDFLYVVADGRRPRAIVFNVACLVCNEGDADRDLRHIEATLTPDGQQPLQYQWQGFYSLDTGGTRRFMWGSGERLPLRLGAGEARLLGLCFEGAPMEPALAWPVGTFAVTLAAWADARPRLGMPDVQAHFATTLTPDAAALLMPWFSPPPGVALKVPVAVPLPVAPRPGAA
ncbi:MAG: toll/interleukin-1 receptor domain-containing protein [Rubrivivax sp.]|nr:toll/interleukin-1 receptor domain-containing protein [Rubrivivax sp.]